MKPLASSSSMYDFIASASGCDNGKTLPLGGCDPGRRSMAQSLARWGGKCNAFTLLKASARSWYSLGNESFEEVSPLLLTGMLRRQFWRQKSDHWVICFLAHEIEGLCCSSHGSPRMMGFCGDWNTNRRMISVWRSPVLNWRSAVVNWMLPEPRGRPSNAVTARCELQATRGMLLLFANDPSIKFPAAPLAMTLQWGDGKHSLNRPESIWNTCAWNQPQVRGIWEMELITVKTRVMVPSGGDRREPQRLSSWQVYIYSSFLLLLY